MFLLKLLTRPNNVKRNMDKSSVYFATKSDETCCNWKSYFLYV